MTKRQKFSYRGYYDELRAAKAAGATPEELDALRAKWAGSAPPKPSVALPERPASPEPAPLPKKPPRKDRRGDRF